MTMNKPTPPQEQTPTKTPAKTTETRDLKAIVGLGASAGGLEALEKFFGSVASDTNLAYVVVQHLSPTHEDMMVEILQRRSVLPVKQIVNGLPVAPNCVYVIPPNHSLTVNDGVLYLHKYSASKAVRLTINSFFCSLAEDQREHAVGVIFSGMGSDGAEGAQAIKANGGLMFVQTPATTQYDSMPNAAIATEVIDNVAPAEQLPGIILSHFGDTSPVANEMDQGCIGKLNEVVAQLRVHVGHDFTQYKKNTILRRVNRRMDIHQIAKINDYVDYLKANKLESELLFRELLIGVTHFFRDTQVWEQFQLEVVPALLQDRDDGGVLRAWVPACSTGEEAYTLAMAFQEALDNAHIKSSISLQIFATDLDKQSIVTARQGFYPASIASDVPEVLLQRYFVCENDGYRISKHIRDNVIFAPQNVVMDPPFTRLDILACRNLLIYLETDLQKKLLPLFHYSLNPGGFLILGSAEATGQTNDLFTPLPGKTRIYRRNKLLTSSTPMEFPKRSAFRTGTPAGYSSPLTSLPDTPNLKSITQDLLLDHFSPAAVLTTNKGDIVYISGKTGKFLEPAVGKANLNLFAMARDGLAGALNEAFARASRQHLKVTLKNLKIGTKNDLCTVNLTVMPLFEPSELNSMVLVVFDDVSGQRKRRSAVKSNPGEEQSQQIVELSQELQLTREELQAAHEEMQSSHEELKSSNEELQSINEELQSSNEELTTSKEEMQSMNEELQTVNQELQAKVDELSRASDDMKNLLNSTNIATLFLDGELCVRRFTSQTAKIIKLIPGDAGRPITDLVTILDYPSLSADAREVLHTLAFKERQVSAQDGRWFKVRTMPYRTQDNRFDGLVITFVDITEAKVLEFSMRKITSLLQNQLSSLKKDNNPDLRRCLEQIVSTTQALLEKTVNSKAADPDSSRADNQLPPT